MVWSIEVYQIASIALYQPRGVGWGERWEEVSKERDQMYQTDQISRSVVSHSLRPHESQHARPPCPSPTPGVHTDSFHRVSDAFQPSHPLSSPSPLAPNPSQHQSLFQGVNSLHEVAKVLEFQFHHHSLQRIPRADLLQNGLVGSPCSPRTLKSLLQHHRSKASILWHSSFFTVQLSHPYMTTGKA